MVALLQGTKTSREAQGGKEEEMIKERVRDDRMKNMQRKEQLGKYLQMLNGNVCKHSANDELMILDN